jgi:hypothetical protein
MYIWRQPLGEIDPFFIGEHFHQLGRRWNIYDTDGIPHQLYFNQSMLNPKICFGWPRLRNYYRWPGIKRLTFIFYGSDSFQMVISDNHREPSPATFPPFHSFSSNNEEYITFRIVINILNLISSKLVSIYLKLTQFIILTNSFVYYI